METEVKFLVPDGPLFEKNLEKLGFRRDTPRTLERNTLYDTPDRKLRASRQILRIRQYGSHWTVTHKAAPADESTIERYKRRLETETALADGQALAGIFERLGFQPVFVYEKWRTEWSDNQGHCVLDQTPLGLYAELEGPSEWIDATAARLGVDRSSYIRLSYGRIFEMWRDQNQPSARNLTFDEIVLQPPQ